MAGKMGSGAKPSTALASLGGGDGSEMKCSSSLQGMPEIARLVRSLSLAVMD